MRLLTFLFLAAAVTAGAAQASFSHSNPLVPPSTARTKAKAAVKLGQSIRADIGPMANSLSVLVGSCNAMRGTPAAASAAAGALKTVATRLEDTTRRRGLEPAQKLEQDAAALLNLAPGLASGAKEVALTHAAVDLGSAGASLARASIVLITGFQALSGLNCGTASAKLAIYKTSFATSGKQIAAASALIAQL